MTTVSNLVCPKCWEQDRKTTPRLEWNGVAWVCPRCGHERYEDQQSSHECKGGEPCPECAGWADQLQGGAS